MVTTASQLHHSGTGITGLPSHLACQLPSLSKRRVVRAVSLPMEGFVAERTGVRITFGTHCAVCTRLNTVGNNKGVTVVVAAVRLIERGVFHDRQLKDSQFVRSHVPGDQVKRNRLLATPRRIQNLIFC